VEGWRQTTWGHAWLAADVVYDTNLVPKIVDLNSGPSFYHAERDSAWPPWFVGERSRLTRAAQDILQTVAFRKLSASVGNAGQGLAAESVEGGEQWEQSVRQALEDLPAAMSGWLLAYNEAAQGGDAHELLANLRARAMHNASSARRSKASSDAPPPHTPSSLHILNNSSTVPGSSRRPTRSSSSYSAWLQPGMCFRNKKARSPQRGPADSKRQGLSRVAQLVT